MVTANTKPPDNTSLSGSGRLPALQGKAPSTPDISSLEVKRHGTWRHEVLDRVGRLRAEAAVLKCAHPNDVDVGQACAFLEKAAQLAAQGAVSLTPARSIENCWRYLRLAEEDLLTRVPVGDSARIHAAAVRAQARGRQQLGSDHDLTRALDEAMSTKKPAAEVLELAKIVTINTHVGSTAQHMRQRSFRTQLRWLTLILAVLAAGLVTALYSFGGGPPNLMPVPPALPNTATAALAAMALGSLGALFSAVPSLSNLPAQSSPFNPVREQAALKIVVGSWSAVVGLVVVQAGIGEASTSEADTGTLAGFAIMAAFFGASQEALTRFADKKAGEVAPAQD